MTDEFIEAPLPELVVVADPQAGLRAETTPTGAPAAPSAGGQVDAGALGAILQQAGATLQTLWGVAEDVLAQEAREAQQTGTELPDLSMFYTVSAAPERLEELAAELIGHEAVLGAYVKPPVALPETVSPPATPDLVARQGYLQPAPDGIDAQFAWTVTGGDGTGVSIIDIEGAWRFTHEDLTVNQGGVIAGTQIAGVDWRNHGTAVLGEISGDSNPLGITGISPAAIISAVSHGVIGSAQAIRTAAASLAAGDLLLLEMHRPGPRHNFENRADQLGFIAVEWWPDDFAAIQYAISRGVIVIEAAGNGAENLDDDIYDTPQTGFPTTWINPLRRHRADSGAIIVGAGAPPPGTHGRDHGPDRSRLDFSNYGTSVDAQGWGREVTTTGYGDLQGGSDEDRWYTDMFSGTSSASPIVTGALACAQGAATAAAATTLAPWRARQLLRATGSPQQDAPTRPATQRIGRRPDLASLLPRATNLPAIPVSQVATEQWGRGWTSLVSFVLDGEAYSLGYKAADYHDESGTLQLGGGVFIAKFDPSGATCTNTFDTSWSKGWTSMTAVDLGGVPHLISYKAGVSGETNGAIDRFDTGGTGTTTTYTGEWLPDWKALATFPLAGSMQLLCYGAGGGGVSIDPVNADGSGFGSQTRSDTWADDWTHFVGHSLPTGTHLLAYKGGLGGTAIDQLDNSGQYTILFRELWQPTWTHYVGLHIGGEAHQIAYQTANGALAIDRMLPDGDGVETVAYLDIGAGWTSLVTYDVGHGPQLLTYNADTGSAAYWRIG